MKKIVAKKRVYLPLQILDILHTSPCRKERFADLYDKLCALMNCSADKRDTINRTTVEMHYLHCHQQDALNPIKKSENHRLLAHHKEEIVEADNMTTAEMNHLHYQQQVSLTTNIARV